MNGKEGSHVRMKNEGGRGNDIKISPRKWFHIRFGFTNGEADGSHAINREEKTIYFRLD